MAPNHETDFDGLSGRIADDEATDEHPSKRQKTTNGISVTNRRKTACQSCRLRKVLEAATQQLTQRLDQLQQSVEGLGSLIVEQAERGRTTQVDPTAQVPPSHRPHIIDPTILEPSRDYLQIPPHRTTADTVLMWPVFENRYPQQCLTGSLFTNGVDGVDDDLLPSHDTFAVPGGLRPPEEERIPSLIDSFLQNVHTKNPILDVEALVKHGRRSSEQGLGWDAWSCLILLACALGSVAKPFDTAAPLSPVMRPESGLLLAAPPPSSAGLFAKELQQGESCFVLACRRLGSLKPTMLGAQCHFFAGVYLMYTLRPLLSWQYFFHASILYQLYLKTSRGIIGTDLELPEVPLRHLNGMSRKQRRLEQCLYWSCFKSECEFRVELPLPQSEIASFDYPNMFPSPPSPAVAEPIDTQTSPNSLHSFVEQGYSSRLQNLTRVDTASSLTDEDLEIRAHAKRLCNEEESWYYYLTEVALRRIGNRIINTFFRQDFTSWLKIKPLLSIALEFDAQVSSWSAHLPPAMQHYETTSSIRAPRSDPLDVDGSNSFVSRELSWATDNRLLEMRSWLYQPFLYYLIHAGASTGSYLTLSPTSNFGTPGNHARGALQDLLNKPSPPAPQSEDVSILQHMITSGIECNLKILDVRSLRHRHHGLWYDLRSTMTASLIILAIIKSGHADLIPGGLDQLFGSSVVSPGSIDHATEGKFARVLAQFEFWSAESKDLASHKEVLRGLIEEVRKEYWAPQSQPMT